MIKTFLTLVLSASLAACGSSGETNQSVQLSEGLLTEPFDGALSDELKINPNWAGYIQNAVQPNAVDHASIQVLNLYNWLAVTQQDNFELYPPIVNTPVTEVFPCDNGQLTRTQEGHPYNEKTRFELDQCIIDGVRYNGETALERMPNRDCNSSLSFRYDNLTIDNALQPETSLEHHILSGTATYASGAIDCSGKGTGGPLGIWQETTLAFASIVSAEAIRNIEYRDLAVSNRRSNKHYQRDDNQWAVSLEAKILLIDTIPIQDGSLDQKQLDVETTSPLLISSLVSVPSQGQLRVSTGSQETLEYSLLECDKNRVMLNYANSSGMINTAVLPWDDGRNVFSLFASPAILVDGLTSIPSYFETIDLPDMPDSDQSCRR